MSVTWLCRLCSTVTAAGVNPSPRALLSLALLCFLFLGVSESSGHCNQHPDVTHKRSDVPQIVKLCCLPTA